MSDFERQTKGNFIGIVAPIALSFATVCRRKMAFYARQGVIRQFLKSKKNRTNQPWGKGEGIVCPDPSGRDDSRQLVVGSEQRPLPTIPK